MSVARALGILVALAVACACAAVAQPSGVGVTDTPQTGHPFLRSFAAGQNQDARKATPWIKLFDAEWHPRAGTPPRCKAATPITFLIDASSYALDNVIVQSNEGGAAIVRIANCGASADVSSSPLTLTLSHLGDDRPVASVRLPILANCGGCRPGRAGSIPLLPRDGVDEVVEVYHVRPGYYHFRLSGLVQVRGSGRQQEFTPAPEPWPSNIVLFTGNVRRALPALRRFTVTSFRGTNIPWDWIDNVVTGNSQAPWMLVDLVAHTPPCSTKQRWYVEVNHAEFDADGQGFQTRVPALNASGSPGKDEYRWHLMPLPAGTTAIRGTVGLDVRSCNGDQPVIAHSVLRMSAVAPLEYKPPTSVSPVHLNGKWHVGPLGYVQLYSGKLDVSLGAGGSPGSRGCVGPLAATTLGSLVCAGVSVFTVAEQVSLTKPIIVQVAIRISGGPTIWEGTLPPLDGTFGPNEGAGFGFTWDQRDASGQQVPPGYYQIFLPSPIEASYIMAGQNLREPLDDVSHSGSTAFIIP